MHPIRRLNIEALQSDRTLPQSNECSKQVDKFHSAAISTTVATRPRGRQERGVILRNVEFQFSKMENC